MPRRKFDAWGASPQSRVALIGASGWIGMALADQALAAGLSPERLRAFTTEPRPIKVRGVSLQTESLTNAPPLGDGEWLVLHAAIIGPDRVENGDLDETRRRNDALMEAVFALIGPARVKRMVMMSSGAAHQLGQGSAAKAAYSRLKREQEETVIRRADRPVLLPRVFNLGGPFMTNPRNYALGDFIISLAKEGRVSIGAADPVFRNFVHAQELAGLLLDLAVDDEQWAEPFDIGGTEVIELGALAHRVAAQLGIADPVIRRPEPADGQGDWYVGDGRFYQRALFETGRTAIPLDQIIADTIGWLRQSGAI